MDPDGDLALAVVAAVIVAYGLNGAIGEELHDDATALDLELSDLQTSFQKGELSTRTTSETHCKPKVAAHILI